MDGTAAKTVGVTVLVASVAFLVMGIEPWRIAGIWVTGFLVIGAAHVFSGGTGWMR